MSYTFQCEKCTEDRADRLFSVGNLVLCLRHAQPYVDSGWEAISRADNTVRLCPTPTDVPLPPVKPTGRALDCFYGKPAADPSAVVWSEAWELPVTLHSRPLDALYVEDADVGRRQVPVKPITCFEE